MHEIEMWIEEAARKQNIPIRKLPKDAAESVQREAMSRYVKITNPRVWWLNLAKPVDEYYDRGAVKLSSVIPAKSGLSWFIPETDAKHLPVYEIDVSQLEKLIDDCPGFEY